MSLSELDEDVTARIEKVRLEGGKALDLYSCGLTEIPKEVFGLYQLESLDLSGNGIRVVPDRIRKLPNLKRLSVRDNPIESVPDMPGLVLDWTTYLRHVKHLSPEHISGMSVYTGPDQESREKVPQSSQLVSALAKLPSLRELYLGLFAIIHKTPLGIPAAEAGIAQLIERIGEFGSLELLKFFGIFLHGFPSGIRRLKALRTLELVGTGISEVPDWISELKRLSTLSVDFGELTGLPDSLSALSSLSSLSVASNRFSQIPSVVFRIRSLKRLELTNWDTAGYTGRITQIPSEVLQLENLEWLSVEGQPVETPPPEVVKKGVDAIKNYWRQQQEAGTDYLCEAKLLIIGEGGAGKTSLAKKINDPNYELQPAESSTEGIEIVRWAFKTGLHVKEDGREKVLPRDFRTNIWDFGGQEVYHATHQFFLTRRSLYLLVADDRKEDTDFNYWLNVVELLSEGSPLLIVQNEKQDRRRDLNLGSLRARFKNLKEAYRVNLSDNRGLEELVDAIRQQLEHLPHIGTPLPRTWSRVREALEKDERNYIGLEEYLAICEQHGFKRREDKLQLSGYLHDLGICLHFQDDPVLKQTLILKPKWGTDAVYRALDDRSVLDNRGRFGPKDLERIWSEDTYAPMRDELLRLMMRFQLCYELPEGGSYIAPQLLSPSQPSYQWGFGSNVVLRYQYEFMPKGLITRFIVTMNHLIADQNMVWKSGAVLEREETRAELVEDYPRRTISLRVAGRDTRGFLAIVDDQLERIHRSFSMLKYEKYLPCNCEECKKSADPYVFPLTELKKFAMKGRGIQCRVSGELVDAAALVQDLFPTGRTVQLSVVWGKPEPAEAELKKEVFVSYKWMDESNAIVDQLEKTLSTSGIRLFRDKNEMKYKDSIQDFMKRIGRGKSIVVILSKGYLESKSCMFELTEIADRKEIRDRVFPIVLEDANIYEAIGRLDYIAYWEEQEKTLDEKMKKVSSANLAGIREERDLYAKIRATIAGIVDTLADMSALTPEQHRGSNFQELERALKVRLTE
jgi:GTPase SAR1 family protein